MNAGTADFRVQERFSIRYTLLFVFFKYKHLET